MENRFDRVVIEFQKEGQSVVSAALESADLETLANMHGQEKPVIIAMIYTEMLKSLDEKEKISGETQS